MSNIQMILGLTPVKPVSPTQVKPLPEFKPVDPTQLFGLEIETERIPLIPDNYYVVGMTGMGDNSLRNVDGLHSWEYLTKPADFPTTMTILQRFFAKSKFTDKNFSERCSIHVHANVQDLTVTQLKSICFLYQVCERLLYGFIGQERESNIYCVPWNQTTLHYGLMDKLENILTLKRWMKYTGLNLLPLFVTGTIEFRHLHGTADLTKIATWLQLIACIMLAGKQANSEELEKEITELNTNSEYRAFFYRIFREYSAALDTPELHSYLETGVMEAKYSLLTSVHKHTHINTSKTPQFFADMQRVPAAPGVNNPPEHLIIDDMHRDPDALRERIQRQVGELRLRDLAQRQVTTQRINTRANQNAAGGWGAGDGHI